MLLGCASVPQLDPALPLEDNVDALLQYHGVPAVAWAMVRGGESVEFGARGSIRTGAHEAVSAASRFHIGSNTKAMTALLAGIAVDRGEITWETTIGEVLPRAGYEVPTEYAPITLRALLSHTGGVPTKMADEQWRAHFASDDPAPVQRRQMIEEVFELPLDFEPGVASRYSNMGTVIAGVMLGIVADSDWETLIRGRVFIPLGMESAGFGPPAADGGNGDPWGHVVGPDGTPTPVDPASPGADNPRGLGPAGTVHASIADLAKYLQVWIDDGAPLITRETYRVIATEVRDGMALGWLTASFEGAPLLAHDGSNSMFYSTMRVVPDQDWGLVVAANAGSAQRLVTELADHLIARSK